MEKKGRSNKNSLQEDFHFIDVRNFHVENEGDFFFSPPVYETVCRVHRD